MTGTTIGDLFVRLGLDATELNTGLLSAEKRLDRFGTQLFFLGSRITAGVSIPLGLALDKIADFGMGFDKAMTESLAIMDHVSAEMRASMESVAKSVSNTTKFSSEEAAKGFYGLASAGLDASTAMGALPIAARFAQAGVMDLAKATDYLATAQAAMATGSQTSSQKVADMARVADVLTMANNKAIGTIQDFAEALTNKAGAALRQSNKTIEEGVAVLMAYASVGIKGKEAGQQLWMSIRDLGIAALKHKDAFKQFHIAVYDANGGMKNMADIIADVERATEKMSVAERRNMFLKLGMPSRSIAATTALVGLSGAIRDYQKNVSDASGVTQTVADNQMKALSNQMLRLGNQFKNAAIDIFASFVPVIQNTLIPLMQDALAVFKDFGAVLASMPDWLKVATLAVAGLAIAIGPVVAFLGSMTLLSSAAFRGVGVLSSGVGNLMVAMGLLIAPSTKFAQFLTFMPKDAALAASEAYNLAKANGVLGFNLNRAATAAANQAGWTGKVTNALIAESTAQAGATGAAAAWLTTAGLVATGVVALGTAIIGTQAYTKDWGETLKIWTIPGYGVYTLLRDLNTRLVEHEGVLGDVARIVRDTATIIYDSFAKALDSTGKAFRAFGEWVMPYVKTLASGLAAALEVGLASLINVVPGAATNVAILKTLYDLLPGLTKSLHGAADQMDRLAGYGTWKGSNVIGKDLMTGGAGPFNMPRNPSAILPGLPLGPSTPNWGGMPDDEGKKLSAAQSAAKNLADQWMENGKAVKTFEAAWASLQDVQKNDPSILDHAWESYEKLRKTQGVMIPQFEALFASQIANTKAFEESSSATQAWVFQYSEGTKEIQFHTKDVQDALASLTTKIDIDTFWDSIAKSMDELVPRYNQQSKDVQDLINKYQAWQLATAKASGALEDLQRKASSAIGDYLQDTAAKLTDAQTELTLFSKSYMDKELIGLKKGLAQQELARERSYRDQLKNLAVFADNPALFAIEMAKLKAADANNKRINELTYRAGLIRLAQSVGVNRHIIEDFERMTNANIKNIIRQKLAQDDLRRSMEAFNGAIGAMGSLFSTVGAGGAGKMLSDISSAMNEFAAGGKMFDDADTLGEKIQGTIMQIEGAIKAFQSLQQVGSRSMRALGGAMAGFQIGNSIVPGWGGVIGAGIGALAGAFMADPDWKMVQKTVQFHWRETVSEALATQIDKDADTLGGHVNAMMMHLVDIANEHGGLGASNVGQWAQRLAGTFNLVANGSMSASQGAKTLDNAFGALLSAGTATDGLINDQIRDLVVLERQYRTGSAAIRDFTNAQMDLVAGGFNKVTASVFGTMIGNLDDAEAADTKLEQLGDKAAKLKAKIDDFRKTPPTNEKQRVALLIAERDLLSTNYKIKQEMARQSIADTAINRLLGPEGQEHFDRLGRIASVTFNAMIGSGKSFLESLAAIGPGLDTLSLAQQKFGFTSGQTLTTLMHFRDFAALHPALVDAVGGLQQIMVGLSNTGFLTQETFMDLGAEVTSTFAELQNQGLSGDEALQVMQPTLQTLWELQHKFGYETDEATGALLAQAEANGTVGEKFMSANDRMILGIDKLIGRFDLFLNYLGVRVPTEAEHAAGGVEEAFNNIDPEVHIRFRYDDPGMPEMQSPVEMAEGGVFMRPVVAGEAGPEAFIPLDRLFAELEAERQAGGGGAVIINKVYIDGRPVTTSVSRNMKSVLRAQGVLP